MNIFKRNSNAIMLNREWVAGLQGCKAKIWDACVYQSIQNVISSEKHEHHVLHCIIHREHET